jgi:hypothetical protein
MNRRSFFGWAAAALAAPTIAKAAEPAAQPEQLVDRLTAATNEVHRQQSAGPSFIGMSHDQFVAAVKGDYPLSHRGTCVVGTDTVVEFDVLATCSYTPPSWLNLGIHGGRGLCVGDVLSVVVRAEMAFGDGRS